MYSSELDCLPTARTANKDNLILHFKNGKWKGVRKESESRGNNGQEEMITIIALHYTVYVPVYALICTLNLYTFMFFIISMYIREHEWRYATLQACKHRAFGVLFSCLLICDLF